MKKISNVASFFLGLFFCVGSATCAYTPADFLSAQVDDPLSPVLSYNLGIAAMEHKKYGDAERHFSLATEFYDRTGTAIVPAYFSWADTASLQLIDALREQKELKGPALDAAIGYATNASNRYANVLVFDAQHDAARERKKVIDRLKQLLESRKEEEKKEEEEEKKNNKDSGDKNQDENEQSSGNDQKQEGGEKQQNKQQQKDENQEQDSVADNDAGQKKEDAEKQKEPGSENDSQKEQHGDQQKQEENNAESEAQQGDKEDTQQPAADDMQETAGDMQEKQDDEQPISGQEEQAQGATEDASAQYDANAEMAKKRAMVLLDKIQQDELALQKAQLLKKSAQQGLNQQRYNQW